LIVAWSFLTAETREIFRSELKVDNATWIRGRGWALSQALIIVPYYLYTNPALVLVARHMIDEILADYSGTE
jgi:aminoglycoside phosphotransferase (APT) family kinase protein